MPDNQIHSILSLNKRQDANDAPQTGRRAAVITV